jgi:hypothetical protein
MGRIAGEVEGVHFGIGDSDAFSAGSLIERALDLQARLGLVVVAPMSSTFDDGSAMRQQAAVPVLRDTGRTGGARSCSTS